MSFPSDRMNGLGYPGCWLTANNSACIVGFYVLDKIEPYHQPFSLNNLSLRYPYAVHETIPMPLALALAGLIPLAVIAVYTLVIDGLFSHNKPIKTSTGKRKLTGPYRLKDRLWEFNCGFLGLLLSQGLAFVLTQVLKNACGKPRPDVIDRCKPNQDHDPFPFGLSNYTICTGDPEIIKDGFKSWPSGHSSSAFAGLFYLSVWLCGKLHVMDNRGEVWKTLLVMVPTLGAILIAVSRIMDARHHPFDVITGSFLGIVCAYVSYRQYFPSVTEAWHKGRAYPIRSWGTEPHNPFDHGQDAYHESQLNLRNPADDVLAPPLPTSHPAANTNANANANANTNPGVNLAANDMPVYRNPSPSIYTAPSIAPTPAPYGSVYQRRMHERNGSWSSSSEDVADGGYGYEMQQGYMRTQNPAGGVTPGQLPRFESDTQYHRPVVPGVTALNVPPEQAHT